MGDKSAFRLNTALHCVSDELRSNVGSHVLRASVSDGQLLENSQDILASETPPNSRCQTLSGVLIENPQDL